MSYHISTVRYEKMMENGEVKRVSEKYLTDSLSITEAVAIVTESMTPYISGEMEITKVEKSTIAEVMGDREADKFFLSKVAFITIDERSGKEKKTLSQWLIGASDYDKESRFAGRNRQVHGRHRDCRACGVSNSGMFLP